MKSNTWQLQEAKNQLSKVVEQAQSKGAQTITKHGKPVVVVVGVDEYRNLQPAKKTKKKRSLVEILRSCPDPRIFDFIEESRKHPDYGRPAVELGLD